MPNVSVLPSGKYRAQVYVNGARTSKSFRTKREAQAWASARELELRAAIGKPPGDRHTLGQMLEKFAEDVSEHRRGGRWERIRLTALARVLPVGKIASAVTVEDMIAFRDRRLVDVKPGTLLREIALLSAVFEHARREWKWLVVNPMHDMRKPTRPRHREVVLGWRQIRALLSAMGYSPRERVSSVSAAVGAAMMLALRTGMRAGEICGLRWSDVSEVSAHVDSKTDAGRRNVPLTVKAQRLLDKMRGFDPRYVVGIKKQSLDAMFRKYRDRAGIDGVVFHDTRHTAATWMIKHGSLNALELCKVFGWTDPKMAMVYFNPSAKDLARRMTTRREQVTRQN